MSLSIMLGLSAPVLPSGKARIHNCSDVEPDWHYSQPIVLREKAKRKGRPDHLEAGNNARIEAIKDKYRAAFMAHGGRATVHQITDHLGQCYESICKYLSDHDGDFVRMVGKIGRRQVWEWQDDDEQP